MTVVFERVSSTVLRPAPGSPSRWLTRCALVFLAALFVVATVRLVPRFLYPYPLESGDGGMLSSAWHVAQGGRIYNAVEHAPFVFNIHNPIFIHLSALVLWLFGPYAAGPRLLGELMLLGSAAFVFLIVRRMTGSTAAALVAALVLPVERHVLRRSGLAICDFCSMFFLMMGLYFWVRSGRWRLAAVIAFVLAYFSKQSAVFVPQAAFAALLLERRWRETLVFEGLYLALGAAGFAVCWYIWGGAFFLNTMYYGTITSFSAAKGILSILVTAACYPLLFVAAGWAALDALRIRRPLVPLLVAAGLCHAYLVGNEGASHAYFFDLSAALAISLGVFWPRLVSFYEGHRAAWRYGVVAALAAQAALAAFLVGYRNGDWGTGRSAAVAGEAAHASLYDAPGMVLSTRAGYDLGRRGTNMTTDPHRFGQMLLAGRVPREELARLARAGAFSAAVVPRREDPLAIFDEDLKRAVAERYRLRGSNANELYYALEESSRTGG